MGQIIELTDTLANQIAAGEVVERPASVVKELVENAIDANSAQIDVWIEEAGLQSIRVVDNGDGILPDDVATAFLRHATSKIHSQDDLFRIRTLGFRGEALPSIASVTEVTMETSTGEGQGRKIKLVGGIEKTSEPSKLRRGTSITVANLFFNTPARLKHIRSTQTEVGKIADLMNRLALSHPDISFRLINEGHELIRTVGNSDLKQTVANVYSVATAKKMRPIEAHDLDFHVSGLVSLPEETRASKNYISIILNGRYIKNYRLNHAIVSGYGSKLMVGRYPIAVINVDTDPLLVDVNVHPTKMEVRLGKEEELFQLLSGAIQKMLKNEVLIPDVNSSSVFKKKTCDATDSEQISMDFSPKDDAFANKLFYNAETSQFETIAYEEPIEAVHLKDTPIIYEKSSVENHQSIVAETSYKTNTEYQEKCIEYPSTFPPLDYIGQMHGTYLFAQNENGLYIVDQHAAQERIKYEFFRHAIANVDLDQQGLLTPIILDLSMDTSLQVQEQMDLIEDLGIHLEQFGDNSYILREQPVWFPQEDTEEFIRDIVEEVVGHKSVTIASLLEHIAIQRSCKRSIKANHFLDDSQAKRLLEDLSHCDNPYNCPHGRPVLVHFSLKDMEKLFKRIQDPH